MTPRNLHPGAWWIWALGLATAASATTNPFVLLLIVAAAVAVVVARRTDAPWALSFRLYVYLALLIVAIRVVFRIVFGGIDEGTVVFRLPEIPLPDLAAGIQLLGPVTSTDLLGGLYDGMRLAAIVLCIGAANTLANPRRLLASLPPALYELGTAIVVALSVFPQLAESLGRVRRARHLRGDPGKGVHALRRIVIPVMEDALDRSLSLAASMDARGYGRAGTATVAERRTTGTLMVAGLIGLCVGVYALLDRTAPQWLVAPFLVGGVVVAAAGLVSAGRRVQRTRYRPDPWRTAEFVTMGCGVLSAALVLPAAAAVLGLPLYDLQVAYPDYDRLPLLNVSILLAVVLAAAPALLTPPPQLEPGGDA